MKPTKKQILKEAENIFSKMVSSNDPESVRQSMTAKIMFISGAWYARNLKSKKLKKILKKNDVVVKE